jgi:inorganic pyrophosphatase
MNIAALTPGSKAPDEVLAIIEIPQHSGQIKYEIDKDSGALCVDRFLGTSMVYPANYGFVPGTLGEDGDPLDVLVVTPVPILAGACIKVRPIGVLKMQDEKGMDEKIITVPVSKLSTLYQDVQSCADLPPLLMKQIEHFFTRYKDLEEGKWVKVLGWDDKQTACALINASIQKAAKAA